MDAATLKEATRIDRLINSLTQQNACDIDRFFGSERPDDPDAAAVYDAIKQLEDNARNERHKIREAAIFGLRAKLEAL